MSDAPEREHLLQEVYAALVANNPARATELCEKLRQDPEGARDADLYGSCAAFQADRSPETLAAFIEAQIRLGTNKPLLRYAWVSLMAYPLQEPALIDQLIAITLQHSRGGLPEDTVFEIVNSAGIAYGAKPEYTGAIFTNLVLPIMTQAAERDQFELLLTCELSVYNTIIKGREGEAQFGACYRAMKELLRYAGGRFGQKHFAGAPVHSNAGGPPKVMFFVHNASSLAHIQTMLAAFRGYRAQPYQPFQPIVLVWVGHDPELTRECAKCGVPIVHLQNFCSPQANFTTKVQEMGRLVRDMNCSSVVFVSLVIWMAFLFAARIAPVQVWWSMKYHDLDLPEIDGCIAGGQSEFTEIHGRRWRTIPHGGTDWVDHSLAPQAMEMRGWIGEGRVILGAFGREEKLRDPAFLAVLCAILARHPQAVLLWTGRTQDAAIQSAFVEKGVSTQTVFIGWVNTKLYAHVIDIFLDSFPLPAGFTIYEAMALGKPAVLRQWPGSSLGIQSAISKLYFREEGPPERQERVAAIFARDSAQSLYFLAKDDEEYVNLASRLIEDPALRQRVGEAGRLFIEQFMSDAARMGEIWAKHIMEIGAEAQTRAGQSVTAV